MYETDTDPNPNNLQRLPKSLSESLEALHKEDFLEEFIGDKLLTAIKAIHKVCVCIQIHSLSPLCDSLIQATDFDS